MGEFAISVDEVNNGICSRWALERGSKHLSAPGDTISMTDAMICPEDDHFSVMYTRVNVYLLSAM